MATKTKIKVKHKASASGKKGEMDTNPKTRFANASFLFAKNNYVLMVAGVVVMLIGFFLMAGGNSGDPAVFDESKIYSFRRITLAPIVIMIGFVIEFIAIWQNPKRS